MGLINGLLKLDLSQQDASAFESRDHLSSVMILHCCSVVALGTPTPRSRTRSQVGKNGTPLQLSPIGSQERAREKGCHSIWLGNNWYCYEGPPAILASTAADKERLLRMNI